MSEEKPGHDHGRADKAGVSESQPATEAAEAYHQRARLAEDRLAEVLAAYRQLKTENDGFRDRITRNVERRYDQRRERLLLRFIEILDNLDRALEAAERTYAGNPLVEGLILVRTQLLQTLQDEGLERIPAVGLPYDPAVSEAVETVSVDDPDQHHLVMKDLQRGYRLNGRVARASRVAVGQYTAPAEPGAAPVVQPEGPASRTGKPEEEITLTRLNVDVSAHATAAGTTELEEDTSLDEIVAQAEAQLDSLRGDRDQEKDGEKKPPE